MKAKKFRKKPVVIEAIQFNGFNYDDCFDFMENGKYSRNFIDNEIRINTLEGEMVCSANDWIIKGVHGEFYPCKPEIFLETYDPLTHTLGPKEMDTLSLDTYV